LLKIVIVVLATARLSRYSNRVTAVPLRRFPLERAMASTFALATTLLLTILAIVLVRRGTRRVTAAADLKNFTVSRQWLMAHQTDERS
jgi:hypothetical protein